MENPILHGPDKIRQGDTNLKYYSQTSFPTHGDKINKYARLGVFFVKGSR